MKIDGCGDTKSQWTGKTLHCSFVFSLLGKLQLMNGLAFNQFIVWSRKPVMGNCTKNKIKSRYTHNNLQTQKYPRPKHCPGYTLYRTCV